MKKPKPPPINHVKPVSISPPNKMQPKWEADFDYSFDGKFWYSQTYLGSTKEEALSKCREFIGKEDIQIIEIT
jgi:hypothetical protein